MDETLTCSHRKLRYERSAGRQPAFADLYRFGGETGPAPLLVHLCGATAGLEAYLERLASEPTPIVREVERALTQLEVRRLDLLVCPDAIDTRQDGEAEPLGLLWWGSHFDEHLVRELGAKPSSIGLVGHSAGGPTAIYLGVILEARAVATLGGAGSVRLFGPGYPAGDGKLNLRQLVESMRADGWNGYDLLICKNAQDNSDNPDRVARAIPPPIRALPRPGRAGGHRYAAYSDNDEALAACAFVIGRIVKGP